MQLRNSHAVKNQPPALARVHSMTSLTPSDCLDLPERSLMPAIKPWCAMAAVIATGFDPELDGARYLRNAGQFLIDLETSNDARYRQPQSSCRIQLKCTASTSKSRTVKRIRSRQLSPSRRCRNAERYIHPGTGFRGQGPYRHKELSSGARSIV